MTGGIPAGLVGGAGTVRDVGWGASLLGGLLAGIPLVVGALQLAAFAVKFGPWEYFSLFVLTLTIVASLSEQSLLKGLLSGVFGLLVTTIGSDPIMGAARFAFGTELLRSGFPFL